MEGMPISEELKRSVFGDLQEPVLEAIGSGTAVRARRYQLELLEKAVHQNVRNLSRLCMVLPALFVSLEAHIGLVESANAAAQQIQDYLGIAFAALCQVLR